MKYMVKSNLSTSLAFNKKLCYYLIKHKLLKLVTY